MKAVDQAAVDRAVDRLVLRASLASGLFMAFLFGVTLHPAAGLLIATAAVWAMFSTVKAWERLDEARRKEQVAQWVAGREDGLRAAADELFDEFLERLARSHADLNREVR